MQREKNGDGERKKWSSKETEKKSRVRERRKKGIEVDKMLLRWWFNFFHLHLALTSKQSILVASNYVAITMRDRDREVVWTDDSMK